jgi:hypothetical protein
MENPAVHLALHGVAVLVVSLIAGLLLYRTILKGEAVASWHLVHASVAARGVMLLALAAILPMPELTQGQRALVAWLMIFFVWTSTVAMVTRAVSGQRGLRFSGSAANRIIFGLYGVGVFAIFPACGLLLVGLLQALSG